MWGRVRRTKRRVALNLAVVVITFMKRKTVMGIVGIFIPFVALIGAIRPGSGADAVKHAKNLLMSI